MLSWVKTWRNLVPETMGSRPRNTHEGPAPARGDCFYYSVKKCQMHPSLQKWFPFFFGASSNCLSCLSAGVVCLVGKRAVSGTRQSAVKLCVFRPEDEPFCAPVVSSFVKYLVHLSSYF